MPYVLFGGPYLYILSFRKLSNIRVPLGSGRQCVGPFTWRSSSGWLLGLSVVQTFKLGGLLFCSLDFKFLGFYMHYNKAAKSLTFRRGSEVGQDSSQL